jgi:serine/threonine protein kinase
MAIDNRGNGKPSAYLDETAVTPIPVRNEGADSVERTVVNAPLARPGQLRPGEIVGGKYQIVTLVGRGGMAEVYRATDINLSRDIALKVMLRAHSDDEQLAERFEQEARLVALLPTDHVVQIHEFGRLADGRPYMALCFAEGTTLASALTQGPICWMQALRIASEVCEGLAFAHERHVLHRDIKPSNIMLRRGEDEHIEITILDFGIAKIMCSDDPNAQRLTRTGEVFGSPTYMSPEQCLPGRKIDERTDIYALGCVLYEMVSGNPPFVGENAMMTMYMHAHEEPRRLETPEGFEPFPNGLSDVVCKALEKDPEQRYQSMIEFRDALNDFASGAPIKSDVLTNIGLTGTVSELSNIANRIRTDRMLRKTVKKQKRNRMMALVTFIGICVGMNALSNIQKMANHKHDEGKRSVASLPPASSDDDDDKDEQAKIAIKHAVKKMKHPQIQMDPAKGMKITDGGSSISIDANGISLSDHSGKENTEVSVTQKGIKVNDKPVKSGSTKKSDSTTPQLSVF